MQKSFKDSYDAIVIGSGIGGLACAATLVKNGLEVLLVEQQSKPGGYCSSFEKKEFVFDSAVDSFSGCGENGLISKTLRELKIEKEIEFVKIDPLRESRFPGLKVNIWADIEVYKEELKKNFTKENEGIDSFFKEVSEIYKNIQEKIVRLVDENEKNCTINENSGLLDYRDKTYKFLLDKHLKGIKLKNVLSSRCAFLGLPPSKVSCINICMMLGSYFYGGSYRAKGGVQKLANVLARGIIQLGGHILLSKKVTKVFIENGKTQGILTQDGEKIKADIVISNIDVRKTFFNLIGKEYFANRFIQRLENLQVSTSFFIVYLGLNMNLSDLGLSSSIGYFPIFDMEKMFDRNNCFSRDGSIGLTIPSLLDRSIVPPDNSCVVIHKEVPHNLVENWKEEKKNFMNILIKKAENVIPSLSKNIDYADAATPITLERFTGNYHGAAYGWAQSPLTNRIGAKAPIKNLYLAGHWTNFGGGILASFLSGLRTAKIIQEEHLR